MKVLISASVVLVGVGLYFLLRRKEEALSDRWLAAQARMDERQGWEGVCWRWPISRGNDAA